VAEKTPSDEEVARQLAEELRKLRVEDVLIQTLVTISSIGYRRLGLTEDTKADRDLNQTRLAIETMRAVTPVLEQVVPPELIRDFSSSVANLQLAYAKAATEAGRAPRESEDSKADTQAGDAGRSGEAEGDRGSDG
jgi:hypothetical protein